MTDNLTFTYRGVTVERIFPSGYYRAYVPTDVTSTVLCDDLDGALAAIDRHEGSHKLTVTIEVTVDPDDWIMSYGTDRNLVADDARDHVAETVRWVVGEQFGKQANGSKVEGVTVTGE